MTNQAIIIIQPNSSKKEGSIPVALQEVNGKIFLHYQLQYLSDNLFEQIVLVCKSEKGKYEAAFGDNYLGMKIIYLPFEEEKGQSGNILEAMQYISDPYVFVFDADNYFRLNLIKADNFRRMRSAPILSIGKKADELLSLTEKLFLNEKGKIIKITEAEDTKDEDTFNAKTWLLNIKKFTDLFKEKNYSLFKDYLEVEYKSNPIYCLSCKQYFISITNDEDLERAKNDFEENYY